MHRLPQELTDYIIDFLHDNPRTLKQASLVSKAWLECSRYHLFKTLSIKYSHITNLSQDELAVPSKYVKKLIFSLPTCNPVKVSLFLSNFQQSKIHTLAIYRPYQFSQTGIQQCFSTFPCAMITSLEFWGLLCHTQTFLAVISLLPNLDNLTVTSSQWHGPQSPELDQKHTISPSFRGRFQLINPRGRLSWDFGRTVELSLLARMPIQFHTVSFYINRDNVGNASSFLYRCAPTVRKISLDAAFCKLSLCLLHDIPFHLPSPVEVPPVDGLFVPCVKLEELRLGDGFVEMPDAFICRVLDSISSRTLIHLTIELPDEIQREEAEWEALDGALVRLQKRQEISGRLTVELSTPLPAEEVHGRLPQFRSQGLLFVGCRDRPSCE